MDELFGASIASIALGLGAIFAILAAFLLYIAVRDTILLKMAMRNVVRRPARSVLIVIGLMLATAIISIAFTTGDSVTFSIKNEVTEALRELDEFVAVDEESELWDGRAVPETFSQSLYDQIGPALEADPDVVSTLASYFEPVAVVNLRSQRFEVNALIFGVQADKASAFEMLTDAAGNPLEIAALAPDEVYIDREGADSIDAVVGDRIEIALGPDTLVPFTVKGISDGYYWKRENTELVVMISLARAQELLGAEGELAAILVTNRGGPFDGEQYSAGIQERLGDLPAITENGLELVPLKSDLVALANQVGSLFVSFFTTFGLFSIGVGLLLIFLIFSMLAAERKGEMGMARAVGMQRHDLVRLFMAEGAIYGLSSAVVGALVGVGLGLLLMQAAAEIFSSGNEEFTISGHVSGLSVLTSFLLGAVITLVTVFFASRRISNLNIVRAIRDIDDPPGTGRTRKNLIWGVIVTALGGVIAVASFNGAQLPFFLFGVALLPIGASLILRWRGVSQRWVLSLAGLVLVILFVMPTAVWDSLQPEDWNDNFSGFFITGGFLVTGAVLLVMNNSAIILMALVNTIGRYRRLTPIVKSAVAYPLRYGFRTGLSVAMFAVVVFSVVVMSVLIEGFNQLFDDQERLAGGYDVYGFAQSDLNPIADLRANVAANPDLAFVSSVGGSLAVGTFRTVRAAEGLLPDNGQTEFGSTNVTGLDQDFIESNDFRIELATAEYLTEDGFDARRLWEDLASNPGLAIVDAAMVPSRNSFAFDVGFDRLMLDVEGLFLENETMDPVRVTVRDLESGSEFELTVIGVLDSMASGGPVPRGLYASSAFVSEATGRDLKATQFFFKVEEGTEDPAGRIEAALFQHGVETLDVGETLEEIQASQRSFFNLLLAFMLLGLVVGIAALGVISARAVVERRHAIGVMRAIGFSRNGIWLSFLAESSFIAIMGIGLGLILGLITAVNVIVEVRGDQPDIQLIIPWTKLLLICLGAYLFTLLTTLLPARQASRITPAEALRQQ